MRIESLDDIVEKMRVMGERLVPYNFPQSNENLEERLHHYKMKEAVIDGYPVVLHYNKADYDEHYLETLQIVGKNSPFLPFNILIKLAIKFLGGYNLSLIEFYRNGNKIYCWAIFLDRTGKPILPPGDEQYEFCDYEGFEYRYMLPNMVNFY